MSTTIEVLVQYEDKPIRRLVFKCPKCGKYFTQWDVVDVELGYEDELREYTRRIVRKVDYDDFICPSCNYNSYTDNNKVEVSVQEVEEFPEVAKKRTIWE